LPKVDLIIVPSFLLLLLVAWDQSTVPLDPGGFDGKHREVNWKQWKGKPIHARVLESGPCRLPTAKSQ
jgi:hypothetical protein